jgi:hypothetical protein
MDILLLAFGLALPWLMGTLLLAALPQARADAPTAAEWPWLIGCGWFVGMFILTLWMRVLAKAGIPFGIAAIGGPIVLATTVLGWVARRHRPSPWKRTAVATWHAASGSGLNSWQRVLWLVLLAWLAIRFALLLAEVSWRPLYPWDAWTQWGTKARVWFELKTMAPFVTGTEWLRAATAAVYFDAAPHYPATVPLFQVWSATLLGRWDDALINLPWWLSALAFGFALYGEFLRLRFDALPALVATWLIVSLPIFDAHVALAGYADLPMATYLTLGALAALRSVQSRHWPDAATALLLLAACTTIKNPGVVWVLTLVPGLAVALLGRTGVRLAAIAFIAVTVVLLFFARSDAVLFGYRLHLEFDPPIRALVESYFTLANWHLLWYSIVAVAILGWRHLLSRDLAPLTVVVVAGLGFLMFGFAFTNARQWVEDQSTVNRATLHLAPLAAIWMMLAFRAWATSVAPARLSSSASQA